MFSLGLLFNAALLLRLNLSNLFFREGILLPHLLNGDINHSATQEQIGASIHKRILFMHSGSSVSETHVAVKLHILKEEEIRETINRSNILSLVCGLIVNSLVILRSLVSLGIMSCFANSPPS